MMRQRMEGIDIDYKGKKWERRLNVRETARRWNHVSVFSRGLI